MSKALPSAVKKRRMHLKKERQEQEKERQEQEKERQEDPNTNAWHAF
jgi:hypothetical protein